MIARSSSPKPSPRPEPVLASKAKTSTKPTASGKTQKVAMTTNRKGKDTKPNPAGLKPAKGSKATATPARYHVVKPQETLYRVATLNGLSVAELRKLNKMGPNDNHIQPGQKLKVGI
jgi:membrane-bound lytic murein transglycosylase D